MKKVAYIGTIIFLIGFYSCNNSGSETAIEEKQEKMPIKESITEDIKPEMLTAETFRKKVWDYQANPQEWVYNGELPCVVDFYADWCKPCKIVAPIMDELADYYKGRVIIYKVNTDEQRELATVFQVRSIPSILFAPEQGQPAMQPGAMSKQQYIDIIDEFLLKINKSENNKSES